MSEVRSPKSEVRSPKFAPTAIAILFVLDQNHETMPEESIAERWDGIRARIASSCERAGRSPDTVEVVAVSKKQTVETIREAAACGLVCFGENRVQEAAVKIPECPPALRWHLVGHLQSNKARPAAELFDVIHSVDSAALLERINGAAADAGRHLDLYLQVNVANEAVKSGLAEADVAAVLEASSKAFHVDIIGLMTMPPFHPDPAEVAQHFRALRMLRDRLQDETGIPLPGLSMGMSHDFEVAIAEGATAVRIGTALLGERPGGMKKPET